MARAKKDYRKVSFNLETEIVERLEVYCDAKGQSKTVAVERILKEAFDRFDSENKQSAKK